MSNNTFIVNAQTRDLQGKGASRRLRHQAVVPAIVYGGTAAPVMLNIQFKDLVKSLESEAFYSHILTLNVDGKAEQVILKALQRHPAKGFPMHADFQRVDATHAIHVRVPLHFVNQEAAIGVKQQGGALSLMAADVEVSTLPQNLPEFLEVDLTDLEVGKTLHISDIKLPEGVTIPSLALGADHDLPIANIHAVTVSE